MAIHRGRVKAQDMMTTLDTILKNAGYVEISSDPATEGLVYKTMGENGTSEFYVQLSQTTFRFISVSVHEKYMPNSSKGIPGIFENTRVLNSILWSTTSVPTMDVDYIININKDRFIIFVEGESTDSRASNGLSYVGLPNRYAETDNTGLFAGIGAISSTNNMGVAWYALRGRSLVPQTAYTYSYYTPTKSYGVGGQLFASPMILGTTMEGPRGELDDLLIIRTPNASYEVRSKDTFTRDGKTYIVLGDFTNANGTLPNAWYALRI